MKGSGVWHDHAKETNNIDFQVYTVSGTNGDGWEHTDILRYLIIRSNYTIAKGLLCPWSLHFVNNNIYIKKFTLWFYLLIGDLWWGLWNINLQCPPIAPL